MMIISPQVITATLLSLCLGLAAGQTEQKDLPSEPPYCPSTWLDARDVGLGCLLFNGTEPMTFIEAVRYCKKAYNSSTLPEVLSEEVTFDPI